MVRSRGRALHGPRRPQRPRLGAMAQPPVLGRRRDLRSRPAPPARLGLGPARRRARRPRSRRSQKSGQPAQESRGGRAASLHRPVLRGPSLRKTRPGHGGHRGLQEGGHRGLLLRRRQGGLGPRLPALPRLQQRLEAVLQGTRRRAAQQALSDVGRQGRTVPDSKTLAAAAYRPAQASALPGRVPLGGKEFPSCAWASAPTASASRVRGRP